jgi:hypothetical protein
MFKKIAGAMLAMAGIGLIFAPMASATEPDPNHKSYVCKYVGKPGEAERASHIIWVDVAATEGTWFKDGQDNSFVLIADTPRLRPEPDVSQCPSPQAPTPTKTKTVTPTVTKTTPTKTTTTTSTATVTRTSTTLVPSKSVTSARPPVKKTKATAVVVPDPVVTTSKGVQRQFASQKPAELAHTGAKTTAAIIGLVLLLAGLALVAASKLTPRRH